MVVDRDEISANLTRFYDFGSKSVLYVGAGGGQVLGPSSGVRHVVAIDKDPDSLKGFRDESKTKWRGISVRFVPRRFETVRLRADTVYFEFCMHQMDNPRVALDHALSLAPDVVVMDHLPKSEWVYYWAGEEAVRRSTQAVRSFTVRRSAEFEAKQRFDDWQALSTRLSGEGALSRRRVLSLKGRSEIRIHMPYGIYLL